MVAVGPVGTVVDVYESPRKAALHLTVDDVLAAESVEITFCDTA